MHPERAQAGEDQQERVNRELIELLNELRVALPGAQVLFAFMLAVPFSQRFTEVTAVERWTYFGALICLALGTALLIAPSSYHRLRFRHRDKERMLLASNRMAVGGMALLAIAMAGVVGLITDVVFGMPAAAIASGGVAAWFAWFWYGLPFSRRIGARLMSYAAFSQSSSPMTMTGRFAGSSHWEMERARAWGTATHPAVAPLPCTCRKMPLPAERFGGGSEAGRVPYRGLLNSITQAYLYSDRKSQRCSA